MSLSVTVEVAAHCELGIRVSTFRARFKPHQDQRLSRPCPFVPAASVKSPDVSGGPDAAVMRLRLTRGQIGNVRSFDGASAVQREHGEFP